LSHTVRSVITVLLSLHLSDPLICNLFHNFSISFIILSWRWRSMGRLFQLISVKSITILESFGMYCLEIYTIQSCNYTLISSSSSSSLALQPWVGLCLHIHQYGIQKQPKHLTPFCWNALTFKIQYWKTVTSEPWTQ